MTKKPGIPPLPPSKAEKPAPPSVEKFVLGAPGKTRFPWENPGVREDLMVQLNVKQPEKLMVQADWFAWQLRISKREFVEDAIRAYVGIKMAEFGIDDKK